jgi:hypothetical protein
MTSTIDVGSEVLRALHCIHRAIIIAVNLITSSVVDDSEKNKILDKIKDECSVAIIPAIEAL